MDAHRSIGLWPAGMMPGRPVEKKQQNERGVFARELLIL